MGMIARNSGAEVNVIALIGERGREVREFVEKNLGEEGMKKSVIVSVTSDKPALLRVKGAYIASSIAEYFRDRGMRVLLMMDSVTRFANAQREIGLAIGEPRPQRDIHLQCSRYCQSFWREAARARRAASLVYILYWWMVMI